MLFEIIQSPLSGTILFFVLALIISSIGFIKVVYFVSSGYAFSIVAMALLAIMSSFDILTPFCILQNLLLIIWGLRLGIFIILRDFQSSYKKELEGVKERGRKITIPIKFMIWIGVSLLYTSMYSPAYLPLLIASSTIPLMIIMQAIGVTIMALGLCIEIFADWQKSSFKAKNPSRFCNTGLYAFVRCPNYLGEILVWVGSFIAGILFCSNWWQVAFALFGVICIILIMIGSTKRGEKAQLERYGEKEDFKKWITTVPVLFPFVKVYSLKNVKVYIE